MLVGPGHPELKIGYRARDVRRWGSLYIRRSLVQTPPGAAHASGAQPIPDPDVALRHFAPTPHWSLLLQRLVQNAGTSAMTSTVQKTANELWLHSPPPLVQLFPTPSELPGCPAPPQPAGLSAVAGFDVGCEAGVEGCPAGAGSMPPPQPVVPNARARTLIARPIPVVMDCPPRFAVGRRRSTRRATLPGNMKTGTYEGEYGTSAPGVPTANNRLITPGCTLAFGRMVVSAVR
jgi:hypothetical protein